jgi:Virulence factor BrkB
MLVIAAAIVVLTGPIANQVGTAFGIGHAAVLIWDIAKWPVLVIIVGAMFALLYKASPNIRQPAFRWVSAGGILAVIAWMIASGLFAVYVSFSGSYNKTYGAYGTEPWIKNTEVPSRPRRGSAPGTRTGSRRSAKHRLETAKVATGQRNLLACPLASVPLCWRGWSWRLPG